MKTLLIAGGVLLAASTAQAGNCAAIVGQIEQSKAGLAATKTEIGEYLDGHGFVEDRSGKLAALSRELDIKNENLVDSIRRFRAMRCRHKMAQKPRCRGATEYAFCYRPNNTTECRFLPVRPCDE